MNTESLYKKFLNGKLAVSVNKDEPNQIYNFYELLKDENFDTPGAWSNCSVLNYLLDEDSGPYHFVEVEQHKINGAHLDHVLGRSMEICNVDKFLIESWFDEFSTEDKTDLNDIEYTNVLFGVM